VSLSVSHHIFILPVLIVERIIANIVRDELLRGLVPNRYAVLKEVDELERVTLMGEEEVEAVSDLFDVDGLLLSIVLQDQLLEEVDRLLVINLKGTY
jgi:hypothetical protein